MRVAILGGGVQGVAFLAELTRAGHECVLFERRGRVGGLWTNPGDVPYLSLQVVARHYRFPDFPWPAEASAGRSARPTAEQVLAYVEAYVTHAGLWPHIRLNAPVRTVVEGGDDAVLVAVEDGAPLAFDLAVCTGESSVPNVPPVYANAGVAAIHTSALSARRIAEAKGKRCVVVGGSKSAADAAIHLDRAGADVTWLARKFYRFAPFDARTSVPLAHVLAKLPAMAARWSAEPLFTLEVLDGDAESGGMGTGNMLDESEHAAARRIKKVRGEAREISKEERKAAGRDKIPVIALRDGRRLPAELVVLATGYRKAHTALETCAASRRIVREMPKGKDSGLITTFGAINFHLLARGMCAWIERGMPAEFATWFGATYARSPSLKAYQLRYLATDGALPLANMAGTAGGGSVAAVALIVGVGLLLLIVGARRRR